jgi:hypothetical protein
MAAYLMRTLALSLLTCQVWTSTSQFISFQYTNSATLVYTNAGDMTADGRLRLWQPEDTARVPLAELQLAPCLKGDQVRVVIGSGNAPAGFTAELAQVIFRAQAVTMSHPMNFQRRSGAGSSLVTMRRAQLDASRMVLAARFDQLV